jgi:hypothetical protein
MASRKEVKKILNANGIDLPFTLKTISFSDLARCEKQYCTLKNECKKVDGNITNARNDLNDIGVVLSGITYFVD